MRGTCAPSARSWRPSSASTPSRSGGVHGRARNSVAPRLPRPHRPRRPSNDARDRRERANRSDAAPARASARRCSRRRIACADRRRSRPRQDHSGCADRDRAQGSRRRDARADPGAGRPARAVGERAEIALRPHPGAARHARNRSPPRPAARGGQPVDRRAAGRHVRRLHQATGGPGRGPRNTLGHRDRGRSAPRRRHRLRSPRGRRVTVQRRRTSCC